MNENVNVCITPKGDKPVLHFSQFDNERVFTVTVLADDGESAVDLTDLDIEFRLRKTDSHVVTIAPLSVVSNVITFLTTEQLCACCGQNIASVVIMNNDSVISTLDILVDIQRDILSGGLTSESDIRNLTTQIEQIVPEVIGDDYYTKTEVDELIDDIPTFDPTNYYDKSDVNSLLSDKADASDVYTKDETDTLLADKADADDVYTKSDVYNKTETDDLLSDKADSDDVMSKVTRHGLGGNVSYFSFDNNCVAPMDNIECAVTAVQSGSGTPSPDNVRPITGHSSCTITVADSDDTPVNTVTVSFGQDVYGGVFDVTGGKLTITHKLVTYNGSENWHFINPSFYVATPADCRVSQTLIANEYNGVAPTYYNMMTNGNIALSTVLDNLLVRNDSIASVADFKTALSNTPLTVLYKLITPVEITFTPTTTDTINGNNKVSSSTGNMKSLTYFSDVNSDLVDLIRACMI